MQNSEELQKTVVLSNSALADFISCRRLAQLKWIEKWEPLYTSTALLYGELVHKGLELFYKGGHWEAELIEFFDAYFTKMVSKNPSAENLDWKEIYSYVSGAIRGYARLHKREEFKIIGTELDLSAPTDRCTYTGTIDLLVEVNGELVVIDHKTASSFDERFMTLYYTSKQAKGYGWLVWKNFGRVPSQLVFNMIRKPRIRLKKTETPDEFSSRIETVYVSEHGEYYQSLPIPYSEADANDFEIFLNGVASEIRHDTNYYPNGQWCNARFACPYIPICATGCGTLNPNNFAMFRKDDGPRKAKIKFGV